MDGGYVMDEGVSWGFQIQAESNLRSNKGVTILINQDAPGHVAI